MDTELAKQNEALKDLEVATLQKRVSELESQLEEARKLIQKHLLEANEVDVLKMRSSDTLTKAKSVIFENTKMIKNQELQIEALNQQVESLRDVVKITKDLLEIRNLEVDQLESKIHCMEEKHKAEKERHDLMHMKLEHMIRHNGDLKREYETQLCLFKALRERYNERELAKDVVDSLKSDIKADKEKKNESKRPVVQNDEKVVDDVSEKKSETEEKQECKQDLSNQNEKMLCAQTESSQNENKETPSNNENIGGENLPKTNEINSDQTNDKTKSAQQVSGNDNPIKIQSNPDTNSVQQ